MNDDQLRAALHDLADRPGPSLAAEPAVLRRRGDNRRARRQAVGTSLATAAVVVVGLGTVFAASHRSRPATPTAADLPSASAVAPSPSTPYVDETSASSGLPPLGESGGPERTGRPFDLSLRVGSEPLRATAGRVSSIVVLVDGDEGRAGLSSVDFGDGSRTGCLIGLVPQPAGTATDGHQLGIGHTFAQAGSYTVRVSVGYDCSGESREKDVTVVVTASPVPLTAAPTHSPAPDLITVSPVR